MDEVFRSQESEPGNQDIDDPVADSCDPHASEVDNDPIEEEASAGNDPVEDLDTGWYVMRNPIYPCDIVENNEGLSIINHDAQSPKSSSARNIPLDEPDNDNNVVAFQLLRHFQETLGGWYAHSTSLHALITNSTIGWMFSTQLDISLGESRY